MKELQHIPGCFTLFTSEHCKTSIFHSNGQCNFDKPHEYRNTNLKEPYYSMGVYEFLSVFSDCCFYIDSGIICALSSIFVYIFLLPFDYHLSSFKNIFFKTCVIWFLREQYISGISNIFYYFWFQKESNTRKNQLC